MIRKTFSRAVIASTTALTMATALVACSDEDGENIDSQFESGQAASDDQSEVTTSTDADTGKDVRAGNYLSDGDELIFSTGKVYEYDDGRTERSPDGGEYGITFENLRTVNLMSEPDPSAPSDHPDAQAQKTGTMLCVDVTARMIKPEKGETFDYSDDLHRELDTLSSQDTIMYPISDGTVSDDELRPTSMSGHAVAPGSSEIFQYGVGGDYSAGPQIFDENAETLQTASCFPTSGENDADLPSGVTGAVIAHNPLNGAGHDQDIEGWQLDL